MKSRQFEKFWCPGTCCVHNNTRLKFPSCRLNSADSLGVGEKFEHRGIRMDLDPTLLGLASEKLGGSVRIQIAILGTEACCENFLNPKERENFMQLSRTQRFHGDSHLLFYSDIPFQ